MPHMAQTEEPVAVGVFGRGHTKANAKGDAHVLLGPVPQVCAIRRTDVQGRHGGRAMRGIGHIHLKGTVRAPRVKCGPNRAGQMGMTSPDGLYSAFLSNHRQRFPQAIEVMGRCSTAEILIEEVRIGARFPIPIA